MSQPISLRLDEKLHAALRGEAARRRVPFADFVRTCISHGIWHETVRGSTMQVSHATALYESRNLLRRLVSARSPQDAAEAHLEAVRQVNEEQA